MKITEMTVREPGRRRARAQRARHPREKFREWGARGVDARQLVRALEADGFVLQRVRGSHRIFRHADGRRVVVAYHAPGDTFPIGTLRAMIAAAGWGDEDLRRLGLTE